MLTFTIIISTYNRSWLLKQLLLSILNQDYLNKKYQIIVVNNNSTDNTLTTVSEIRKAYNQNDLMLLNYPKYGKSYCLNYAISFAKNNLLIFLDDDEKINKNFLSNYNQLWSKYYSRKKVALVGGRILPYFEDQETNKKYSKSKLDSWVFGLLDFGTKEITIKPYVGLLGGNYSIKKEILIKIGKFDTHLGVKTLTGYKVAEDYELCFRLHRYKYLIIYSPKLVTRNLVTKSRFNLFYLLKRYFIYGIEISYTEKKHLGKAFTKDKSILLIKELIKNLMLRKSSKNVAFTQILLDLVFRLNYFFHAFI